VRIADRLREHHRASFTYDESLLSTIASRCREVESGARNVDHILTGTLLPELSGEILTRTIEGQTFKAVHVTAGADGKFAYQIT
jgi:type VI secretion system protein VasG